MKYISENLGKYLKDVRRKGGGEILKKVDKNVRLEL
jgi:hypothetical protein